MEFGHAADPVRICAFGMDERTLSTFRLFLQGPCKNRAVLANDRSAEAILVDLDGLHASEIFARERQRFPNLPFIVTSLRPADFPDIVYVAKPLKAAAMLAALDKVRLAASPVIPIREASIQKIPNEEAKSCGGKAASPTVPTRRRNALQSAARKSTHRTAMLLDEKAYSAFVGTVADIDVRDPHYVAKAHYDKQKYLQAYLESAVKLARTRKRILQLNCGWHPITIFPHTNEIWIDADDKQIRAFCVVPIGSILDIENFGSQSHSESIISPVSSDRVDVDRDPRKFQSIDAFIWKVALWTANGRVPDGIKLDQPVYLTRWPNLSRFVVTPHALRIAAVLVNRPMTLLEVAKVLDIRQHYVFSFFSAAMSLGLAGQSRRQPAPVEAVQSVSKQRTGLLQKILTRLKVG